MPKIETYASASNQITARRQAYRESDFADTRGLQNMQNALGGLSELTARINDEKERSVATKIASDARIEWEKRLNNSVNDPEFNNKYGQDGGKYHESILADFTKYQGDVVSSNGGNKYLDNMMTSLREDVAMKSINYQSKFAGNYIKSNYETSLDNIAKIAKYDPQAADKELENFKVSVAGSSLIDGMQKNEIVKSAQSKVGIAAATGFIDRNPMELSKIVHSNGNGFINKVSMAESSGNATAKNPNSSATGAGQFIKSTWLSLYKEKYGASGMSDAQILELRKDPVKSKEMIAFYAQKNTAVLERNGVKATDSSLYLSHFLDAPVAVKVLKAPRDTPIKDLVSADAISANKSVLLNRTVGDVIDWADRKMKVVTPAEVDASLMSSLFPSFDKLTSDEQDNMVNYANNKTRQYASLARQELRTTMTDINNTVSNGIMVKDDVLDGVADKALSYGLDEEYQTIVDLKNNQTELRQFVNDTSLAGQSTRIEALKTEIQNGDISKSGLYEILSKTYETKLKSIKEDPWGYYSATGIISTPTPVTDVQSFKDNVSDRLSSINLISARDGVVMPLLSAAETLVLKENISSGSAKQVAQQLTNLSQVIPDDYKPTFASQLSKVDPVLASAMVSESQVAIGILNGDKIKDAKVQPSLISTEVSNKLQSAVQSVEILNSIQASVFAYYKHLSLTDGALGDSTVDPSRLNRAIKDVVGDVQSVSVGGNLSQVIVPSGMTAYNVQDSLDSINDKVLSMAGYSAPFAGVNPIDPQDLIENGRVISTGDGKYGFFMDGIGIVQDKDGNQYSVDIKKISEAIDKLGVRKERRLNQKEGIYY